MFIINTNMFLNLVWPVIFEWATIHGYKLPNTDYLDAYAVKRVDYITTTKPNTIVVGRHNSTIKQISLVFPKISKQQKMLTLIHEYAHAIQYYNLKKGFRVQYCTETDEHGYYENRFEIEARFMASLLELEFDTNSKIAHRLRQFNWLFAKSERSYSLESFLPYKASKDWGPKYFGKFLD